MKKIKTLAREVRADLSGLSRSEITSYIAGGVLGTMVGLVGAVIGVLLVTVILK